MSEAIAALAVLTLIKATPLIYAALGGVIGERAGVVNIGLEGMLAAGAFAGVAVSHLTGNPIVASLAGTLCGIALGLLLGAAATRWNVDQIVAGTGLNLIALGGAAFALIPVFGRPGASIAVPSLGEGGEIALVAAALGLAVALHAVLRATPWGLRIRAAGENPYALAAAGIDPLRVRLEALAVGGALAGLGGVFLSIGELDLYTDGMTAGRGFIALAAVIFGRWTPLGATGAALFFGFFAALEFTLQRSGIPSEAMQALPYLAALAALTGIAGRARAPAADGIPFKRE